MYFGVTRSTSFTQSAGVVRATAPHHLSGWVNVQVVLADGRRTPYSAADRYRYVAPPRITAVQAESLTCSSPNFCIAGTFDGALSTFDGTDWSAEVHPGDSYDVSPSCAPDGACVIITNHRGTESTYVSQ